MTFLAGLVAQFFVWLIGLFGKKIAIAVTVGATFVAGWIALQAALLALWVGLGYSLPEYMTEPIAFALYAVPDGATACLSAAMAGKIAAWLWAVQREWLKVSASAS